jgi:hypothetical protein
MNTACWGCSCKWTAQNGPNANAGDFRQNICKITIWRTERGGRGSEEGVVVRGSPVIVEKQKFYGSAAARRKSAFLFNDLRFPTARCSVAGPRFRYFDLLVTATCRWRRENRKFIYTLFIHAVPIRHKNTASRIQSFGTLRRLDW